MNNANDNIKGRVDIFVVLLYAVLVVIGWLSIYGASYEYDNVKSMFDLSTRAGTQLIWMGTSFVLAFILLKLDNNLYEFSAYFLYIFFILLLLVTLMVAPDIRGSRSWLVITDSIRLQPAEFAKFAVALTLAKFINDFKLLEVKNLFIAAGIVLLPMVLIFFQKETGSALVYSAFILALYREGLSGLILLFGLCAAVLFVLALKYSDVMMGLISLGEFIAIIIVIIVALGLMVGYRKDYKTVWKISLPLLGVFGIAYFVSTFDVSVNWGLIAICALGAFLVVLIFLAAKYWTRTYLYIALFVVCAVGYVSSVDYVFTNIVQPHQQMRIKVSLGMEDDPMGAGYNVIQSKIAVGSGGLAGKGFLNGTQTKLKYVPEQDTDFIFCTVGEEQGFIGSSVVLLLFLLLILRLIFLAEQQRSTFGRVYGYCVASVFLFHLTINVGMVIGLLPVIGIPLPFFSYGGSSLWGFTILLFIFLRIDMSRKKR